MVAGHRRLPRADADTQCRQETRRIVRVRVRVEGVLQARERIGMVLQIDLEAANVDRPDALGLQ